jgi:hypothetical protein
MKPHFLQVEEWVFCFHEALKVLGGFLMKREISILIICLTVFSYESIYAEIKPEADLDNFRGIKWGTDFSTLPKDEFKGEKSPIPEEKVFSKENENLDVLGVRASTIQYRFYDNRLIGAVVEFNFNRKDELKDSLTKFLGKPDGVDEGGSTHILSVTWKGNNMWVNERINFKHEYILLIIHSTVELDKRIKKERDTVKEKAKKRF